MKYTNAQKNIISALLQTRIAPRTKSASLRQALLVAHEHMYNDALTESDLILINSALELLTPEKPEDSSKEEYRDLIETLLVTRSMMRESEK